LPRTEGATSHATAGHAEMLGDRGRAGYWPSFSLPHVGGNLDRLDSFEPVLGKLPYNSSHGDFTQIGSKPVQPVHYIPPELVAMVAMVATTHIPPQLWPETVSAMLRSALGGSPHAQFQA
jgi:hypothetical protein